MLDFPNTPTNGQTFTGPDGAVWVYDGVKWRAQAGVASISSGTGITATPNPITGTGTIALTVPVAVSSGGTGSTTAGAATSNNVGRNLIHNPLFNITQRGMGPWTTTAAYTADRWAIWLSLDTVSATVQSFNDTQRAQIGDEAARNAFILPVTGNAGASAYSFFTQQIENVYRLSNQTVTVSFWSYVSAGTAKVGVGLRQNFGTGGSPSGTVDVSTTAITLSTTPTRYSATFTLPSMSGKTLGTNNDSKTELRFYLSAGANTNALAGGIGVQSATFIFWGVQLEIGSTMTPLEKPDPQQDLAKCQRFYQSPVLVSARFAAAAAGQILDVSVSWPRMRAAPTLTGGAGTAGNVTSATLFPSSPSGGRYEITAAAAGDAYAMDASYNLSADL